MPLGISYIVAPDFNLGFEYLNISKCHRHGLYINILNNNIVRTYGTQLAGNHKPQIEIWGYNISSASGTFSFANYHPKSIQLKRTLKKPKEYRSNLQHIGMPVYSVVFLINLRVSVLISVG